MGSRVSIYHWEITLQPICYIFDLKIPDGPRIRMVIEEEAWLYS